MRGGGWIAIVIAAGCSGAGCKSKRCASPLVVVSEPVTDQDLALPILATLEDVEPPKRENNGCEYGEEEHRAKLGPLAARYSAMDYKGQTVTTGATLLLSSPTCPATTVSFTMSTRGDVRVRHDPKRDLYVVTNRGGTIGMGSQDDEKLGAILVRLAAAR